MKHIILIIITLINCKSISTNNNFMSGNQEINGIAYNEKAGAVIRNQEGIFLISGLREWSNDYLNKKVCVTGKIKFIDEKKKSKLKKNEFNLAPQMYPKYNIILSAKWKLCE